MNTGALNARERAFVNAYLLDPKHNATKAATKAGYSKKTAYSAASRLLKKVEVKASIAARLQKVDDKVDVSVEYVIKTLKEVIERSMTHEKVMEFDHVEKEMVHKQQGIVDDEGKLKWVGVYEFDSAGANRALELVGKYLKMFQEKMKIEPTEEFAALLERACARVEGK